MGKRLDDFQGKYKKTAREAAEKRARSATWLKRFHVTPNGVTWTGAIITLAACGVWCLHVYWRPAFWLGIVIAIVGALFDLADGAVARALERVTKYGGELDTCLDRAVETGMFAALVWVLTRNLPATASVTALGGSILVSYLRTRAEKLGLKGDVGLGERQIRLPVLGVGVVLGYWFGYQWVIYVMNLLVWLTVYQRLSSIKQQLIAKGTP